MAKRKPAKTPATTPTKRSPGLKSREPAKAAPVSSPDKPAVVQRAVARTAESGPRAAGKPGAKPAGGAKDAGGGTTTRHPRVAPTRLEKSPAPFMRSALGTNGETIELVDPEKPLPKTKLNAKELRRFKELLLIKRRELLGDVSQLSSEALRNNRQDGSGDLSNMPTHMADIGSDNWEQEFTIGLIATERALLREIDDALERIEHRTFGVCLGTHRMIGVKRLEAKPWARYCIEYARLREAGRAP